jgi:hypothetical protein
LYTYSNRFPRPQNRGPIEAGFGWSIVGLLRSFRGLKTAAPLKRFVLCKNWSAAVRFPRSQNPDECHVTTTRALVSGGYLFRGEFGLCFRQIDG